MRNFGRNNRNKNEDPEHGVLENGKRSKENRERKHTERKEENARITRLKKVIKKSIKFRKN
jgi:hypothetical protein